MSDDAWAELEAVDRDHGNVIPFARTSVDMDDRPTPPIGAYADEVDGIGAQPATTATPPDVSWPTKYDFFDEAALPVRRWVYGHHYLRQFVSVLASAGGIGKTSMQIVEALAICTGRPLLGEVVHEQCNVWVINLEDPMEEMQRRVLAAMRMFDINPDEVIGRLFLDAGRDFQIKFAVQTKAGILPNDGLIDYLIKTIPKRKIGAVFIDPFVGAHDVNENDNGAINAVLSAIRRVADETDCSIGLVHHIRKGNGEDANIDSVRGAGSLIGAARAARVINRMSEDEAARLGIDPTDARSIFRVDDGKVNLSPPADKTLWRRMVGVKIGNGEWVGVAVKYDLPDAFDGVSEMDARRVRAAVADANPPPRENHQSKQWVGHIVADIIGLDLTEKADKARAMTLIKTWIKGGVLATDEAYSARDGRDVRVIVAGSTIPGEVAE